MRFKCPLCNRVSPTGALYREHLATKHDLVDDEGTSTWVEPAIDVRDERAEPVLVAPVVMQQAPVPPQPEPERELMLPWSSPRMDPPLPDGPVRRQLTRIGSYLAS